jgi:hypothetical protein
MLYQIFQIMLSDAEVDLINSTGDFNSVPKKKLKLDMDMNFKGDNIAELATEALEKGYYVHVSNITANDLNDVFKTGNIGPEENIARFAPMHSISVGDLIVDESGVKSIVAPMGFVELGLEIA